jgi:hypothetical protein
VDYLYSLYDALVGINVPSDKARAVVDAMERDMGTTLATKQDLKLLEQQIVGVRNELRLEIGSLRGDVAKDLQSLRSDVAKDLQSLRSDVAKDLQILRSDIGREMEVLRHSMTLRLGSMLAVGVGVILAAMRLGL